MALDRRAFLAGMVATLVPCSAGAQPQRGLPAHRIGWISTEAQPDLFVDGFREACAGMATPRRMPAVTVKAISRAYEAGLGGSELIFEAR